MSSVHFLLLSFECGVNSGEGLFCLRLSVVNGSSACTVLVLSHLYSPLAVDTTVSRTELRYFPLITSSLIRFGSERPLVISLYAFFFFLRGIFCAASQRVCDIKTNIAVCGWQRVLRVGNPWCGGRSSRVIGRLT